jgi:hydroxyacylglutathione hydrolase
MLLERIESKGLAHYSYLVGDGGEAVLIDPHRDVDDYLALVKRLGVRLRHVIETHRNEDYLVGSHALGEWTGADVWHADTELDYHYGRPVEDGARWPVGDLELEALHTPGHTPGHMCYLLRSQEGEPWILFSGDCLFAGDVGRTDLCGEERLIEMTEALHDSLHGRVLPLGDHVLLMPAHGPGSACGGSIAERPWTTIGLERALNPLLGAGRDEFVRAQARLQERPPYFSRMEERNLLPGGIAGVPAPAPLDPGAFAAAAEHALVLDTRLPPAYLAAHVPGSLSIWEGGLGSWAGWFLPADEPLLLVTEDGAVEPAVRTLLRMGFDDVIGTLRGGMHAWHTEGLDVEAMGAASVPESARQLAAEEVDLLDVRTPEEVEKEALPGATHIPLQELGDRLDEVPRRHPLYVFCGSGLRSTVTAGLLAREGRPDVTVVLGGVKGWSSVSLPLDEGKDAA